MNIRLMNNGILGLLIKNIFIYVYYKGIVCF